MPPKVTAKDKSSTKDADKIGKPKSEVTGTTSSTAPLQLKIQVQFHVSKSSDPPTFSLRTVSDWYGHLKRD